LTWHRFQSALRRTWPSHRLQQAAFNCFQTAFKRPPNGLRRWLAGQCSGPTCVVSARPNCNTAFFRRSEHSDTKADQTPIALVTLFTLCLVSSTVLLLLGEHPAQPQPVSETELKYVT
jgi:hypothetical protein